MVDQDQYSDSSSDSWTCNSYGINYLSNQTSTPYTFVRQPLPGETIYNLPSPFVLEPRDSPLSQAVYFFSIWERENPDASPSPETYERCLRAAVDAVRSHPQYPGGEFIKEVCSFYNSWATHKDCDERLAAGRARRAEMKRIRLQK